LIAIEFILVGKGKLDGGRLARELVFERTDSVLNIFGAPDLGGTWKVITSQEIEAVMARTRKTRSKVFRSAPGFFIC